MQRLVIIVLLVAIAALAFVVFKPAPTASRTIASTAAIAEDGVLAAGEYYAVALDRRGRVFGWGGYETNSGSKVLSTGQRPRLLLEGAGYRRVNAGHRAIYALDASGQLWRAALAAATDATPTPTAVFHDRTWKLAIETWSIGVGIDRAGALWYWSDEDLENTLRGQVYGDSAPLAEPRQLMMGVRFVDACVQGARLHAVDDHGRLWRSDDLMRRGPGDNALQGERTDLNALAAETNLRRVYCRENAGHVLALDDHGQLWGYGLNLFGELGFGDSDTHGDRADMQATQLKRLSEQQWIALAIGPQVSFGIAADGSLWGWGRNLDNELGLGNTNSRATPTLIDRSQPWVAVTATYGTGIALAASGELYAWGRNALGALGDGGIASSHDKPAVVLTSERFGGVNYVP